MVRLRKLLPNMRVLCEGMRGQNYWFNGCMEYLMECLGESKEYDYWFFSGVSGDSFTQLYSRRLNRTAWCLTHNLFGNDIADKVFNACGYDYQYVNDISSANRESFIPRIRESIDRGIPVIARGGKDTWEFCNICGYDDTNLYYLICDSAEPRVFPNEFNDLIFVGDKKYQPRLADVYRQVVMEIPSFITRIATFEYSFGKQAFIDWAESFQNGTFDNVPVDSIDPWSVHGTYLAIAGTNGASRGFLREALKFNSDMTFINQLEPIYAKHGDVFETLAYRNGGINNGFNISREAIKDSKLMMPVSEIIMESARFCDEILELFINA